ncbi:MAG: hypothetical protein M4579_003264 [Chaenotheca gracillima]|nr:MAG: hypothetical protein M4579_003264 [Chaenotheca gracillima]
MVNIVPWALALVGIGQYLSPMVRRSWQLAGFSRNWDTYAPTIQSITSSCATAHEDVLSGCADMKLHGRTIYATCLSQGSKGEHRRWISPQTVLRDQKLQKPRDELIAWNLDTDTVTILDLNNYANSDDRAFHGLDIVQVSPSLLSIYVINHLPSGSVIEKFTHEPLKSSASHVATFSNPSLVPNPHSVWAVPGEDTHSAFYVTSDKKHRSGLERVAEVVLQLRSSPLIYHSTAAGWKSVSAILPGSGAITGLKDPQSNRLFVAETTGGFIDVFDRVTLDGSMSEADASLAEGNVTFVQRISLDFVPSGLALDQPTGKDLYISGLPRPFDFLAHHGVGPADTLAHYGVGQALPLLGYGSAQYRPAAGSLVSRLSTGQLGSSFFGGDDTKKDEQEGDDKKSAANQGYTSPPSVESVFVDQYGKLVNGSYSVVFDQSPTAGKGDLFVSGLSSKGMFHQDLDRKQLIDRPL